VIGETIRSPYSTIVSITASVSPATSQARVEHRLVGDVERGSAEVEQRRAEHLERAQHLVPILDRSRIAAHDGDDGLTVQLHGHEVDRRRPTLHQDRRQLVGRLGDPLPIEAQQSRRLLGQPVDRPCKDQRADAMKTKLELGDDSEVAPAAAQTPEELRVLCLARLDQLAVGGDQVDRAELVDRQPVLPMQPTDTAAERQSGDARVADEPTGRREPKRLGLAVELAPERTRLHPRLVRVWIDPDALHRPQVDDDAVVADRVTGIAVPSAANGDRQAGIVREPDSCDHVRDASATRDQRGEPINRPVPDPAAVVVGRVARHDHLTVEAVELAQRDVGGTGCAHSRPQHCRSVNVVPQRPGSWSSASP
jgi:hypothetical protein